MSDKKITLSDRIKELSRSTGTGNLRLDGAVTGFDSFGNTYSYNDLVYYAVTDGTDYEVGSGQYILDGGNNALRRFPVVSSNSNSLVNFSAGVKEVYVSYPGTFAVFTASGMAGFQQPDNSGLAFWGNSQTLNYSPFLVWDNTDYRLGVQHNNPEFAIHIGGLESYSAIYSSGTIVGDSGVMFSGVNPSYSGGRQLEPFLRNQLDATTGTEDVFSLSGLVDQRLLFKQQTAGLVFAGPPSGCTPPLTCSPDYPTFRALTSDDIPDLSSLYLGSSGTSGNTGEVAFFNSPNSLSGDPYFFYDSVNNFLGINQNNPTANLDVSGNARIITNLNVGGYITATGNINATTVVFSGDGSMISGAYQAGSGLELHNGLEFNIGNLFKVGDNSATSGWIHQSDVLSISGVSGISTDYSPNSNIIRIGYSGGVIPMSNWNIHDGIGGSGSIFGNNTLTVSGVSGISTQYDQSNKLLRIGVSDSGHTIKVDNVVTVPLSGISLIGEQVQNGVSLSSGDRVLLVNQTDARQNGIWEVGADPYGSWTRPLDFPSSGEASARWTHVQQGTHYDESVWFCVNNNPTTIDYDDQEWRYFDGGAGVSGWVNGTFITADSVFTRIHFNNEVVQIGGSGTGKNKGGTSSKAIMIGGNAGLNSSGINYNTLIGYDAGFELIDSISSVAVGHESLTQASGIDYGTNVGYRAGARTYKNTSSIFIGDKAGYTAKVNSYQVGIGYRAAAGAQSCGSLIAIGNEAGLGASGCANSILLGQLAGYNVSGAYQIILKNNISTTTGWEYENRATPYLVSIGRVITGQMNDGYIRIGQSGLLSDYSNSTLSVKSKSDTRTTLKLEADNTQTASQLVSSSGTNNNNTIINSSGLLRIPTFGSVAAATGVLGGAGPHNSGVLALAGTSLIISDGSSWLTF